MRADYKISYIKEGRQETEVKAMFYYGDFELVENPITKEMENTYVRQGSIDIDTLYFSVGTDRPFIENTLQDQLASYCSLNGYEAIDEQK